MSIDYKFISEIETHSYDVLAGTASTLTCKIVGVETTTINFQWVDSEGQNLSLDTNDRNITVRYDDTDC